MVYFLQDIKESDAMRIEIEELKIALDEYAEQNKTLSHQYKIVTSDFFKNYNDSWFSKEWMKKYAIPVGSIEFVQTYLKEFHDINKMSPIEIPKCLRLPHLLLRDYQIVSYCQLPTHGNYFVKDVSKLKSWSYCGDMASLLDSDFFKNEIDTTHFFQVSTKINILSEYRVCVMDHEIIGIQFYDGDPTVLPNENEIKKIKEMVIRWSMDKNCPKAATMDVAVIKTDNENGRDLALIECHPFVSVGTYGCRGRFLPNMFKYGLQWYVNCNNEIER